MRLISGILYYGGIAVIFLGIWIMQKNLLLGVDMMPAGLVLMFIGWVLDAYEVGY